MQDLEVFADQVNYWLSQAEEAEPRLEPRLEPEE